MFSERTGDGPWGRSVKSAPPMPLLRAASAGWGLGEVAVDPDFVSRRQFPGRSADDGFQPSLAWAMGKALGLESTGGEDPSREQRWIRYCGKPFTLPHLSFSRALEPDPAIAGMFRDKIVLVGARPMAGFLTERRDELRSPFRSWLSKDYFMPGVEVHATQMLNLIRGDSLRRPPPGLELLCVLMAGALVGAGLRHLLIPGTLHRRRPWCRPSFLRGR